ncbi:unnamed protein product [Amoebophrya sp. A25]|nr:unnamed protein product [Amoebophrya sp. A25]|eukprot:GSA25T00015393001.1
MASCTHASCSPTSENVFGWYDFAWSGGSFEVCFRPGGHFFAPKFQAASKWQMVVQDVGGHGHNEGNGHAHEGHAHEGHAHDGHAHGHGNKKCIVRIDWGAKFGQYELEFDPATKAMKGMCTSTPNASMEKDWRTAAFKRPISPVEAALFGEGAGSEWMFQWSGGEFPVIFKGDGYNHFQCHQFPAHAHWSLAEDGLLTIFWEKFGTYEMRVDPVNRLMEGSAKGEPENWRKARFTGNLPFTGQTDIVECAHHH